MTPPAGRLRRLIRRLRGAPPSPAARCEALPGTPLPPLPAHPRLLVLALDRIGDFVLALPALERLRQGLPEADITLVCGGWNRELAAASGLADRVVAFDAYPPRRADQRTGADTPANRQAFAALAAGLGRFDLALDLRHDPDTRPLLMLATAGLRAGFAAPLPGPARLDLVLPRIEDRSAGPLLPAGQRMLLLVQAVLDGVRPPQGAARRLLPPGPPVRDAACMVLAPGAGVPLRIWPVEHQAAVARAVAERHGLRILLAGSAADAPLAAAIAAALPPGAAEDLTGRLPLPAVAGLVAGARLFLGMDSGLTHMAAALGVPTVAIHAGVSDHEVWRARGPRVRVLRGAAACSPCWLQHPAQCPHGVACLAAVGVAEVLAACEALLAAPAA